MPKYKMTVVRVSNQTCEVEIEADDRLAAMDKAFKDRMNRVYTETSHDFFIKDVKELVEKKNKS